MSEASEYEVRSPAEASKAAIDTLAQVVDACGDSVAKVLVDLAMAPFLRVQIRRLRGEPFHFDLRVRTDVLLDHGSAVSSEPVPDYDEWAGNMALEVASGADDIVTVNCPRKMSLVDVAGYCQPDHRGEFPALAHTAENRRPADGGPSRGRPGPKREAGFIHKDDGSPSAARLF